MCGWAARANPKSKVNDTTVRPPKPEKVRRRAAWVLGLLPRAQPLPPRLPRERQHH